MEYSITRNPKRVCEFDGCYRTGRNKGLVLGLRAYGKFCVYHHKLKQNKVPGFYEKVLVENKKCERCGWEEAHCDRHRRIKELGYVKENLEILCPNCHRVAHQV